MRRKLSFGGDENANQPPSPFVLFAWSCFRHVGLKLTHAAVRQQALRVRQRSNRRDVK